MPHDHESTNRSNGVPDKHRAAEQHGSAASRPFRERLRAFVNPGTILAAGVLVLFVVAAVVAGNRLGVPLFSRRGAAAIVELFGPWAPVAYVAALAVTVVISHLPGLPLAVAAGAMWGSVAGAALSVAGGLLGSVIAYLIGRHLGGSIIYFLTGRRVSVTEQKGRTVAGITIFVTRLIPLMPFDIISYGAGLARVPFGVYILATAAGMAPSTFLLTYLGDSITDATWVTIVLTVIATAAFIAVPIYCRRRKPPCLEGVMTWQSG